MIDPSVVRLTLSAESTNSPICKAVVQIVPLPPAIVPVPSPLSTAQHQYSPFRASISLTDPMHLQSTTQSKQPQLQPPNLNTPRHRLVQNAQILHLVFARPKLFQNPDILERSIDGVDGNTKLELTG